MRAKNFRSWKIKSPICSALHNPQQRRAEGGNPQRAIAQRMNTEQVNIEVRGVGKSIATAFVKAQQAFGPALKSSQNPHYKSKYADLSACVEAVVDALNGNGIAFFQRTYACESGVTVETVFLHTSGETLSSGPLHVPASKQDPQGYGSALTYARRYSLMAACGIAPEDDDGNAASKPVTYAKPSRPAPRMTDEAPRPRSNGNAPVKATTPADDDEIPF